MAVAAYVGGASASAAPEAGDDCVTSRDSHRDSRADARLGATAGCSLQHLAWWLFKNLLSPIFLGCPYL